MRTLKWEDLDDLLKFINLLVEKADILKAERRNLMHGGRGRWTFGDQFRNYKRAGYSRHVGVIGIASRKLQGHRHWN
ncbi:MAG: hypothetical protein QW510_05740 [Candidatus Bathyarchaeia archaeon]